MKYIILISTVILSIFTVNGQADTLFSEGLFFRNIGPANQGGRIVDIDAHDDDFDHVYAATASGGVWKSINAGTTWEPIFDHYETASIGDIAIDQKNKNTIWVGTGEANNRNSVSWGNGIYKSTDAGDTFVNKGLENTHQIARVLVHPDDSDEVCVCAIGHLWGYSGERGLFKSSDGGETWNKKVNGLPNDGKTGCTDLVRDTKNPDVLYAAYYHRLRQPWHFHSGGEQGGIYKSIDGGESWKQLTNGLPSETGRIGLAIYDKDPNIVMAFVEAKKTNSLDEPGSGVYRSEDAGATWKYINTYNNRPFYYSQIRINPSDDQRVYLLTTRFMVSTDGGHNFENGSKDQEVHGDFHAMWLDPSDTDRYYLGADKGMSITHDHGTSFRLMDNMPIGQFYRINYDMQDPYYVYGGLQDNGSYATASFSRDARGILNDANWKMHWGDGQDSAFNPDDPTDGYSSTENGTYFKYNIETRDIKRISPKASNTINHWDYFNREEADIPSAIRFNWSAPLMMSSHNPKTLFIGGNHVYKSINSGMSWEIISPDLSSNDDIKRVQGISGGISPDNTGAETHCAIYSIAVSTINEDIIWVGTDDGNVQVTQDGGQYWDNVGINIPGVPKGLWVSRVESSRFDPARAYVTYDGHRSDEFGTWIFKTENFGKTWQNITSGIDQGETVRVIREDVKNPNLLFIGTETGVWYTIDRGSHWIRMKNGLPTVSVYDIKIHPRENDLIIGTHGRSIWIMDDISPLQNMHAESMDSFVLFDQKESTLWENVSRGGQRGHFWWAGDNPKSVINTATKPRATFMNRVPITFYSGLGEELLNIKISTMDGSKSKSMVVKVNGGTNRFYWDRSLDFKPYTDEELADIHRIFDELIASSNSSWPRSSLRRFENAKDFKAQRKLIHGMTSGYRGALMPADYGIPFAQEGTYRIEIDNGKNKYQTTISIRKDPMTD